MLEVKQMYTLKTARDRLGLSQKEAAKRLGISDDVLSNYERGKTYPNVLMLKKIESVYGVKYDQLLFLKQLIKIVYKIFQSFCSGFYFNNDFF